MITSSRLTPLISRSALHKGILEGEVVIVTGAGRGIGFETASALLWLGARVVVAELNEQTGSSASEKFEREYGADRVLFVRTDVGSEEQVTHLAETAIARFGKVDAVLNNASSEQIGAVKDAPIQEWDLGYHVDLRGPVLLARAFVPDMLKRRHGVFVCVSSSGAAPFMGPYEVFKTAQVELANTLAAELEGTGVFAFAIGPGIVRTPGFLEAGSKVASMMGITTEELVEMNKSALLSPEEAGTGFAGSIALASKYNGSETSSVQVLRDIGIGPQPDVTEEPGVNVRTSGDSIPLLDKVIMTYSEQSQGWKNRGVFQRQWVLRDFKKQTGISVDEMVVALNEIRDSILNVGKERPWSAGQTSPLYKLSAYYKHQGDLLRGFEKDPKKLDEGMKAIQSWIAEIQQLVTNLGVP